MRRHTARPFGQSVSSTRLLSLVMMLCLVWVAYGWAKNPANWRWLTDAQEQDVVDEHQGIDSTSQVRPTNGGENPVHEQGVIVPGPNDLDSVAFEGLRKKLVRVTDRTPLKREEMPPYWELLGWSRTESFSEQKKRAAKDIPFTQTWDEPGRYRGKLQYLRLHVRRALHFTNDDNPLGIKDVYEAWGWTDESKSYPYVIVFSKCPPELPLGDDVRAEIEFTGYFLKLMSYKAFDVDRAAPLLIGRVKIVGPVAAKIEKHNSPVTIGVMVLGVTAILGLGVWNLFRTQRTKPVDFLPDDLPPLPLSEVPPVSPGGTAT